MKRGAEVAFHSKKKVRKLINDCMQVACNQSVSVCIGVRSLVKSSLDLQFFFFFLCFSPDKYGHYSEYASDTIYSAFSTGMQR